MHNACTSLNELCMYVNAMATTQKCCEAVAEGMQPANVSYFCVTLTHCTNE